MKSFAKHLILLAALFVVTSAAQARTLRLFIIGNSFSQNATRYLPQLAKEGGHELILGRAEVGGCSLERHWNAAAAAIANPEDEKGKFYGGKTLKERMGDVKWDVVTMQQYSLLSPNVETYRPFAQKLHDYVKTLQPQAEVVMHQTWAYRADANSFGFINKTEKAKTQQEMWQNSRAAYRTIAAELNLRLLPSGDAFWRVDSDPLWGYKKDAAFDFKNPVYPALPDQTHSLHVGYRWDKDKKFGMDANHANAAGCYLAGLVWYGVLFGESPEKLTFAPPEVPADFAAHLRKVASDVVQQANKEGKLSLTPAP